jgi:tetratricopeptide (TPR) repeat protein
VRPDRTQLLLELVRDGKITPEQAIELARLLESQAFAAAPTTREARNEDKGPAAAGSASTTPSAQPSQPPDSNGPQVPQVSAAEFNLAARKTARESWAELLAHPDATVRTAAAQLRDPATLDRGMRTLWDYAAAHPGPTQATIYRICGAVGEANNHPLGLQALERARDLNPQNSSTWRMLSYGLRRDNKAAEAQAAALVGEGLDAQREGRTEAAERSLEQALPNLQNPEGRAFVEGQLGDAAAKRGDWDRAVVRYESAFSLRERRRGRAAAAAPPATLNVDAQKLVRAYDRSGRTQEACRAVARAQDAGVDNPDAEVAQRCVRLRILRPSAAQTTTQLRQSGTAVQRVPSTAVQRTN